RRLLLASRTHSSRIDSSARLVRHFFFSSRRRHTSCYRDWSSDVCSSDLVKLLDRFYKPFKKVLARASEHMRDIKREEIPTEHVRSEERRVGKEWRSRGAAEQEGERREESDTGGRR